jgi:phospho-N-acetylmuramoyl-pentapeptide-transferase
MLSSFCGADLEALMLDILRTLLVHDVARVLLLSVGAALFVLVTGHWWLRILRYLNLLKRDRTDMADQVRAYRQLTMGGIMIVIPVIVITIMFNLVDRWSMLLPLGVMMSYAVLGMVDDYYSLTPVTSQHYGLTERVKALLQMLIAVVASAVLYLPQPYGLEHAGITWVPLMGLIDIGMYFVPIGAFIIWVTVNSVNITDGIDGLSGWTLLVAFATYGVITFVNGQFTNLMALSFTLVGACAGYLWFNAYPASVIMGDSGSMALGGILAMIALQSQQWILLPLIGAVFVVEGLSSFVQMTYFQWSRWRTGTPVRLFAMAPLHHHLRLRGWSNPQITQRFVVVAMACGFVAVAFALQP